MPDPDLGRPRIVCLCGSTRFLDAFDAASIQQTLAGHPGHLPRTRGSGVTPTGVRRRGRLALLALPIAPLQGVWLTRTIARYADAHGRIGTVGTGPGRRTVVALGDSVTAGYAVPHHRASVAGQLAARLSARENATVTWRVCAKSGATAYDALGLVDEPALADADLFFVSVGVNDLKNGHGAALSSRSGRLARHGSRGGAGGARVCLLGFRRDRGGRAGATTTDAADRDA